MQTYSEDKSIGAEAVDEILLNNAFLNINYIKGNFSAGIRYESYLNALLEFDNSYNGNGIPYKYLNYKIQALEITAGNFYDQIGQGLIFRTYENKRLGIDNALDGFRIKYNINNSIHLKSFIGKSRTYFTYAEGIIRGGDIEININNLLSLKSIIFGLLGLAIFLNVMHLPRSAPIVGGMVLALMTLPTIIIATRVSLKAVPPSIREAAVGLGATKFQSVIPHVLPLAIPGIATGTIIGMSRALGESAPLLLIGMVAFIVDIPGSFTDSATVLPVQIYLWKSTAARGFVELTAAGVIVLLTFLILMNALAIYVRNKFEKKW